MQGLRCPRNANLIMFRQGEILVLLDQSTEKASYASTQPSVRGCFAELARDRRAIQGQINLGANIRL